MFEVKFQVEWTARNGKRAFQLYFEDPEVILYDCLSCEPWKQDESSRALQSVVTVTWESSRCPGSGVIGHLMPTSRKGGFKTGSEFWFYFCSSLVPDSLSWIETTAPRSMNLRFNSWNLFQSLKNSLLLFQNSNQLSSCSSITCLLYISLHMSWCILFPTRWILFNLK